MQADQSLTNSAISDITIKDAGISDAAITDAAISDTGITDTAISDAMAQDPYPGLNSYDEKKAGFFYGRDKEKQGILQILDLYSLCFLIGKSGLGKTSLINAGIIPELKRTGFIPINIRINFDDSGDLSEQVKRVIEQEIIAIDPTADLFNGQLLWEYFHNVKIFNGYLKPVLIFDQFEEIFTRGPQRQVELNHLLTEIFDLAENKIPKKIQDIYIQNNSTIPAKTAVDYRIIFSLREDYLPQLTSLKSYIPTLRYSTYRLEQITGSEAFKAVYYPAQKGTNKLIDKETAWEIIKKIPESSDDELEFNKPGLNEEANEYKTKKIEPFLLNLFCYTLNEERKFRNADSITKKDVLNKSFEKLVIEHYNRTTAVNWKLSAAIERELITPDGRYRKFSSESNFVSGRNFFGFSTKLTKSDLVYLVNKKIIRRKRINNISYFELIHDVLVPVVVQKRKVRNLIHRILGLIFICCLLLASIAGYYRYKIKHFQDLLIKQEKIILLKDDIIKQMSFKFKHAGYSDYQSKNETGHLLLDTVGDIKTFQVGNNYGDLSSSHQSLPFSVIRNNKLKGLYQKDSDIVFRQVERRILLHQNDILKDKRDSNLNIRESENLTALAQKITFIQAQRTLSLLAYNTLPLIVRLHDDFIPDVFSSLIQSQIKSLTNSTYYRSEPNAGFKNLNDILIYGNSYCISRPFKSIISANGTEILTEPNLVKSWVAGNSVAMEVMNNKKDKSLIIKSLNGNLILNTVNLAVNQDITSFLFDPNTNSCIYTTKQPSKVYHLNVNVQEAPSVLYDNKDITNDGTLFIIPRKGDNFAVITESGKYIFWSSYSKPTIKSISKLDLNNDIISCIGNLEDAQHRIGIGCMNGSIYFLDDYGKVAVLGKTINDKNIKVTTISQSDNGKWLVAGYLNNYINLWRFDSNQFVSICLLNGAGQNNDEISSARFIPASDELIAVSSLGNIYKFPLSMKVLANRICSDGNIITDIVQWKQYIPSAKFQSVCQ